MDATPTDVATFAPGGVTAIPAYSAAAATSVDTSKRLAAPGANGAPRPQSDVRSATRSAWSKARNWVASRPAASMAASFVAGGIVGWLTSKLK